MKGFETFYWLQIDTKQPFRSFHSRGDSKGGWFCLNRIYIRLSKTCWLMFLEMTGITTSSQAWRKISPSPWDFSWATFRHVTRNLRVLNLFLSLFLKKKSNYKFCSYLKVSFCGRISGCKHKVFWWFIRRFFWCFLLYSSLEHFLN